MDSPSQRLVSRFAFGLPLFYLRPRVTRSSTKRSNSTGLPFRRSAVQPARMIRTLRPVRRRDPLKPPRPTAIGSIRSPGYTGPLNPGREPFEMERAPRHATPSGGRSAGLRIATAARSRTCVSSMAASGFLSESWSRPAFTRGPPSPACTMVGRGGRLRVLPAVALVETPHPVEAPLLRAWARAAKAQRRPGPGRTGGPRSSGPVRPPEPRRSPPPAERCRGSWALLRSRASRLVLTGSPGKRSSRRGRPVSTTAGSCPSGTGIPAPEEDVDAASHSPRRTRAPVRRRGVQRAGRDLSGPVHGGGPRHSRARLRIPAPPAPRVTRPRARPSARAASDPPAPARRRTARWARAAP